MNKLTQTIIDGIAVFGACLLAIWIRFDSGLIPILHNPAPPHQPYTYGALFGAVIVVLALQVMKTYEKPQIGRLLGASLLGVALLIAASFIFRIETAPPFSRIVMLLTAALIPLFLLVERLLILKFMNPRELQK